MPKYICTEPCFHLGHRYRRGDTVVAELKDMPWQWADKKRTERVIAHFQEVGTAPSPADELKEKAPEDMTKKELVEAISAFQDVKSLRGLNNPELIEILTVHRGGQK